MDGEYIYYEGTVTNMLHIPSVKGYLFIGREVTKQVLAEQALIENEERFRAITELHQDITIIVNNQLKAVYVSPSVQQLIGHQPEDLLGDMRNLELLPKDIDLIIRKTKSIVDRPGASVEIYSLKIKHKNGESLYFDAIGTNLFHIPSVKGIVFTARDVTDRIKTHREREASERRYQSLFNQTNDGIILYKPNGVVQSANQRAAEIFGGSVDDLIGREVKTLVDPEDVLDYQLKTELLLSNQSLPVFEQRIIHENGNTVPIEVNLALVKDADNNLLFIQAMFRDITLRKLTEDRLKHLATHDSLTGLPNRDVFYAQLRRAISRAKRENVKIAVLYIDLDDFKNVNDSLGHIYGDQLLKSFGDRLKENLRDYDTVARMGGDEFTVILDSVDTRDDAIDVAEKLAEKISKPFQLDKHKVVITCSIGIGIFPDDGNDAREILIAADKEMYRYKQP